MRCFWFFHDWGRWHTFQEDDISKMQYRFCMSCGLERKRIKKK